MTVKALSCTCGDCLHWEVLEINETKTEAVYAMLKCKTCEHEFPVTMIVPAHDKLEWVDRDAA
jgi:hypothetical protein